MGLIRVVPVALGLTLLVITSGAVTGVGATSETVTNAQTSDTTPLPPSAMTAEASSWGSYSGTDRVPSKAVDGSDSTSWGGTEGAGDWLQIRLDSSYTLDYAIIDVGYHSLRYDIQVSRDGESWETIARDIQTPGNHHVEDESRTRHRIDLQGTQARYVRIAITGTNAPQSHIWQAIIEEVTLYPAQSATTPTPGTTPTSESSPTAVARDTPTLTVSGPPSDGDDASPRAALLPILPPGIGDVVIFLLGLGLMTTVGVARTRRGAVTNPSDVVVGVVADVGIISFLGTLVGVVVPTGWTPLSLAGVGSLLGAALLLGLATGLQLITLGITATWLGVDLDRGDDQSLTLWGFIAMIVGIPLVLFAPEVLSSLGPRHLPQYGTGMVAGVILLAPYGLYRRWRDPSSERRRQLFQHVSPGRRVLDGVFRIASGLSGGVRTVAGYPYRRYRARRQRRRTTAQEAIERARSVVDQQDSPVQAAETQLHTAIESVDAGDYDRAEELADEAIALADRERELWTRLNELSSHESDVPSHDPTAVEESLSQARDHLTNGRLDHAADRIEEAERLAGPSIEFLLAEARTQADEARQLADDTDDIDSVINAWKQSREAYEEACDRAEELDDTERVDKIQQSIADIETRITDLRAQRQRTRRTNAAADAWSAVRDGDDRYQDDPEAARDAYERAIDNYDAVRAHLQDTETEAEVDTALSLLDRACTDCRILSLRTQLATALADADQADDLQSACATVLASLQEIGRDTAPLDRVAARTLIRTHLTEVRETIHSAESLGAEGAYFEAKETLETATDTLTEAQELATEYALTTAREEVDQIAERHTNHINTIETALAAVDDDPTLEPIRDLEQRYTVTETDVPPAATLVQALPVSSHLWETISPEAQDQRSAVLKLSDEIDMPALTQYGDPESVARFQQCLTRIEECDPVVAASEFDEQMRAFRDAAVDLLADLEATLAETIDTLETADTPDGFYRRPSVLDESITDDIHDVPTTDAFVSQWEEAATQLIDALHAVQPKAKILDAYETAASYIEDALDEQGQVTPADLPMDNETEFMQLYAYENDVIFNSDTPALRRREPQTGENS